MTLPAEAILRNFTGVGEVTCFHCCDEEVIHMINDWFELQDKQFFVDGVISLAHRWEKRVVLEGD